jgi:diguanylate cyclase (GGDEF)-like protein
MVLAGHAGRVVQEAIRRRDAVRDPLTGLYNRRHFKERVEQEIKRASRSGHTTALLLCDLDRFKKVNDTHGHQAGDKVLKAAATAIKAATRGTDLHFRWGGDELVVVLSNTTSEGVLRAAARIRERIRSFADEKGLDVDMSVGIALYPDHGRDEEELLRVADLAMYVAKKSGDKIRVGYETYQLDEQCVRFVYQPIMDLRREGVHGHEIFARDPGGQLSPLELFDKYRAVGQLDSLKRLIFEQQLRQSALAGVSRLFVNTELDFLAATEPLPAPTGVDVILEIAHLGPGCEQEGRLAGLARWRQAGYKVALGGFGADFSSLHLMESIRPEYLKVARAGLVQAESSADYRGFLGHLLQAATSLVAPLIVCEGIESRPQLVLARTLGAPLAQGFLLGRPEEEVRLPGRSALGDPQPGFRAGPEPRA